MWRKFEELREIEKDIADLYYPKKLIKSYNERDVCSETFNGYIKLFEPIDIKINNSHIEWRHADQNEKQKNKEYDEKGIVHRTQYGVFHFEDWHEFGGNLYLTEHILSGTFDEVFDYGKYVIAIDSFRHILGSNHINVYAIDSNLNYKIIYSSKSRYNSSSIYFNKELDVEEISHCQARLYDENGNLAIFIPVEETHHGKSGNEVDQKYYSKIIIIDKKLNISEITLSDFYGSIEKVIIDSDSIYIGADKEVVIYNRKTMSKKIFTPLSDERVKILVPIKGIF